MSLTSRLEELITAIGEDIKELQASASGALRTAGDYSSAESYVPGQLVRFNEDWYQAIVQVAPDDPEPGDVNFWEYFSPAVESYSVVFTYDSSGDANGLIYYLGTRSGEAFVNPIPAVSAGQLTAEGPDLVVSASGVESGYAINQVTDRAAINGFISQNEAGSTFRFDLKTRKFQPNHLTIRHRADFTNNSLVSFVLEGSNDAGAWTELLNVANAGFTNTANEWRDWAVVDAASYRYLRIRSTGPDFNTANYLVLGEVEFYGTLFA